MSIGKSSSLPAIILNVNTSFEKIEKSAKLEVGPTCERPGPILLMVATTAVKLVIRSLLSRVISNREVAKSRM